MRELLILIDNIFLVFTALALFASLLVNADNSSRLTLAIWIVGNFCMDRMTPMMSQTISSFGQDFRGVWYLIWATCELSVLYAIWFIHRRFNLNLQSLAKFVVLCLFSLCALQVFRYFDRDLGLNLLADVYRYGVLAINISVFPMACLWLVRCYVNHYKEAKA
ncbi:hypothetical protein [Rheinheimera sp.]|uniref:hypothetical protein n=1 Tax=Rheinheimera sp. TaxID=1869214 RepID=UPI003AF95679